MVKKAWAVSLIDIDNKFLTYLLISIDFMIFMGHEKKS